MKTNILPLITEFTVIAPVNDREKIGDTYTLNDETGEYTSLERNVSVSLLTMIDHPLHYRISKIKMGNMGRGYIIPEDREQNYLPRFHPSTMKFYLVKPTHP